MKIKEIPKDERPRERLKRIGIENMSSEDIISLIVSSGTKGSSSKDIALIIMSMNDITLESLMSIKGIGIAKASKILASIELSNRLKYNKIELYNKKITNSSIVFEYFKNKFESLKQEHFYCLFLDSNKKIIKEKLLFVGTLNYSVVHPREIFKEAYLTSADSIICIHNHPAHSLAPSNADFEVTEKIKKISELHGIVFLDHIIVAGDNYFSFRENGHI